MAVHMYKIIFSSSPLIEVIKFSILLNKNALSNGQQKKTYWNLFYHIHPDFNIFLETLNANQHIG